MSTVGTNYLFGPSSANLGSTIDEREPLVLLLKIDLCDEQITLEDPLPNIERDPGLIRFAFRSFSSLNSSQTRLLRLVFQEWHAL